MRQANIAEIKNQLSQFLRFVKQGEVVTILERGVPIAQIHPIATRKKRDQDRLAHLEARGIIKVGKAKPIKNWPLPKVRIKSSLLKAVLEEREEGW